MSRLALCITIIAAPLRRKTLIEPGTIPRYSPSRPVARACASQFLPAWAWFLRFSNGHTTQNPINAQPPLEKNCPAGVDA